MGFSRWKIHGALSTELASYFVGGVVVKSAIRSVTTHVEPAYQVDK